MQTYIKTEALDKIHHWVDKAKGEVSGLGMVKIIKGKVVVMEAMLLEQECTSSTTDLKEGAVAKMLYEIRDQEGHLNFWWHSHANMRVFWSGTDDATIKEIGGQGFCLAAVFNKSKESLVRYFQNGNDFFPPLDIDEVELKKVRSATDTTAWDAEFDKKVKDKVFTYTPAGVGKNNNNYNNYNRRFEDAYGWYNNNGVWEQYDVNDPEEVEHITYKDMLYTWDRLPIKEKKIWRQRYLWLNWEYGSSEFEYAEFYGDYCDDGMMSDAEWANWRKQYDAATPNERAMVQSQKEKK